MNLCSHLAEGIDIFKEHYTGCAQEMKSISMHTVPLDSEICKSL